MTHQHIEVALGACTVLHLRAEGHERDERLSEARLQHVSVPLQLLLQRRVHAATIAWPEHRRHGVSITRH